MRSSTKASWWRSSAICSGCVVGKCKTTFPIWLNIPLSKSSAFFKPLSICETLAVGMAIITP